MVWGVGGELRAPAAGAHWGVLAPPPSRHVSVGQGAGLGSGEIMGRWHPGPPLAPGGVSVDWPVRRPEATPPLGRRVRMGSWSLCC